MKVYHYRTRDGEAVVWRESPGRLVLLAPPGRPIAAERVAVEVLADAIGRRAAWPLGRDFAAFLATLGERWDLYDFEVESWVVARG